MIQNVGAGFTPARKGHYIARVVGPASVPAICFPGDYFSYHTIVIPDEAKTRSGIQCITAFSLDSGQSLRAFRNDGK